MQDGFRILKRKSRTGMTNSGFWKSYLNGKSLSSKTPQLLIN